ncbi:glutathione S-transferase [Pluteus cervinus]|uniref:Glutathione S-transferase n=1 Tax=Pluteus cervinus TaxID=181527 RepID=A0ACD3AVL5_9AGAR|nr:glutathione S-transferase [Pluteus cervinus]
MSSRTDSGRSYHKECTGDALDTAKDHSRDEAITLFGSCFCPFVQRVWIAFEYLGIPYKVYEVDPYQKPQDLLEVSPKGLVPGLRLNEFNPPRGLNESTVILEYLQDLSTATTSKSLLPSVGNPYARSLVRLQADHVNRNLVPAFYRFLQAQDPEVQATAGKEYTATIETLVSLLERTEREVVEQGGVFGDGERRALAIGLGLWFEGGSLGWIDAMAGPWLYRTKVVLGHYRGFKLPSNPKLQNWLDRLFEYPAFKATRSSDQLYIDSYERYAFNRPNTSQVANAINSGRALP